MSNNGEETRDTSFDILRGISVTAVIAIHATAIEILRTDASLPQQELWFLSLYASYIILLYLLFFLFQVISLHGKLRTVLVFKLMVLFSVNDCQRS